MAIDTIEVLKWVAVIFVAGFVGYFGKYLSKLVIARMHKKPGAKSETPKPPKTKEEIEYDLEKKRMKLDYEREKNRLKLEKKRMKTEKKLKK